MKRIVSILLTICVLLSIPCISFAASDYNSYRAKADKINSMNIPLQKQSYRVISSGSSYKSISDNPGICNVVAATQLLNRRLAYDSGSSFSFSNAFTMYDVITACGNTVTATNVDFYHTGKGKTYSNCGFEYSGEATAKWYNNTFTAKNGFKYKFIQVSKPDMTKNMGIDSESEFKDYLVSLLKEHPEGVHYRGGGHCIVFTDYVQNGNEIVLYAIDGVDNLYNNLKRNKFTDTWQYKHNGVKNLYKSMSNSVDGYIAYIDTNNSSVHTCPPAGKNSKDEWNYQTYNGKVGVCKECKTPYNYTVSKKSMSGTLKSKYSSQKISVMSDPYEDATCLNNSVIKNIEVVGALNNAYNNEWYAIDYADSSTKTCFTAYVYAGHIDKYYDLVANNHRYEGGNFIEDTTIKAQSQFSNNTPSNTSSNNTQSSNNNTQTSSSQAQTVTAPQQPTYVAPSLTLSSYSMEIDHVHESSRVITVNVSGTLPNGANLNVETTPGTTAEWGSCVNGKAELTILPNWKLREVNSTVTVSLRDGNNNIILQKQLVVSTNASKYTVYFDTNGGYGGPSSIIGYYDDMIVIPFDCPSRGGYKFVGWAESRNATSATYDRQQGYYINKNTTLYAVWEDLFEGIEGYSIKLSDDELYLNYNSNRSETLLVVVDEDFANDYTVDFDCDNNIKWSLGDYWYNADGHMCREIIIEATKKDVRSNEATVYLKDELGKIRKEKTLEIYTDESYNNRNENEITVYLDGKKLDFDVPPSIINGRTMVPMRKIFEEIGAFVYWDNETQTAFGETVEDFVTISIGDNYLEHNGEFVGLDSPATVISGRTLVPARAIAESFNCDVDWIGDLQVVTIESPKSKYNEDLIVGEWDVVAEIDGYTSFYPYDRAIATYEFNDEGGVYITYHDRDDMDYFFYDVTKGGFVIIYNQPKTMYMLGTIAGDEIYFQECNEYLGNELLRWGTVEGDTFIRRQFKNDKGVNYLEEDDGFVLERK